MYVSIINNQELKFDVFGVWRKNMVMRDRQSRSLWQHATGEAIFGPLKGAKLELMPAWETTWGEFKATHPEGQFVKEPDQFTGFMPKSLLIRALRITEKAQLHGLSPIDNRMNAHEIIIGIVLSGESKAYKLSHLREVGIIKDIVGGEEIHLEYHSDGDRVIALSSAGTPIHYERQWWLGWSEFHARSEVFEDPNSG